MVRPLVGGRARDEGAIGVPFYFLFFVAVFRVLWAMAPSKFFVSLRSVRRLCFLYYCNVVELRTPMIVLCCNSSVVRGAGREVLCISVCFYYDFSSSLPSSFSSYFLYKVTSQWIWSAYT